MAKALDDEAPSAQAKGSSGGDRFSEVGDRAAVILESMGEGYIVLDDDFRHVYVNAAAEKVLAVNRDDLLGTSHWEAFPEAAGTEIEAAYRSVMADRVTTEFETLYKAWDRWFAVKVSPAPFGKGIGIQFQEITEQKRAKDLLVEQNRLLEGIARGMSREECFRALCEAVPRLSANARACVLLIDDERRTFTSAATSSDLSSFGSAIVGTAIGDLANGSAAGALKEGRPITSPDINADTRWSITWQHLCALHDIRAGHLTPIAGVGGGCIGSFFLCLSQARTPTAWELRLGAFGSHLGGIALERDRTLRSLTASQIAVHDSDARLKRVVDGAKDYAIVELDAHGKIIYWNAGAERLMGWKENEILGHSTARFFTPEDQTAGVPKHELHQALREGRAEDERWHIRKDGSRFWGSGLVVPLADGDVGSSGTGFVKVFQDRTVRRQATAALRASEERFRQLAETIPNLAWMAHPDGHIFWYNQRWYEYTGTTAEEMQGWGWQSVHDVAVLPQVIDRWRRSIGTGEPFQMVFPLRGADGIFRPFLTLVNPLRDDEGSIIFWFGTNTDISDQKRAEEQLRENDKRKDEFLATLAHELRNPLAPIRTGVAMLRMNKGEPSSKIIGMMDRQLSHMVRLIDDLMDVSRISRGKLDLQIERVELDTVVQSALEASRPFIDAGKHDLVVTLPREPVWLDADPTRLAQTLTNLVNNAAKYTPSGGKINLEVKRHDQGVTISVKDNGLGISGELLPSLFDLFTQVGRTLDRAQGGLGIGLYLVKQLVEMHGGQVSARSGGLGKGSTFTVRLRVAHLNKPEAEGEGASDQSGPSLRILVVDDNQDAADIMATLLEAFGHQTRIAYDGKAALDAASQFNPQVAFLDIGLPGMSGYELAQRFRLLPALAHTVLVALTGWGAEADRMLSKDAGFNFHLTKPADAEAVRELLNGVSVKNSQ